MSPDQSAPATATSGPAGAAGGAAGAAGGGALATLSDREVRIREALERLFLAWAEEAGARRALYPPLLSIAQLERLDVLRNFPQLVSLCTHLHPDQHEAAAAGEPLGERIPAASLAAADYALPTAACYSVYLDLAGRTIDPPVRVTTAQNCFRREQRYEGLKRLLGFHMREIVCVGERDHVLEHLAHFKTKLQTLLERLELPHEIKPSQDPFFDQSAARALMAQLFPVKEEILHQGQLAIASLNYHRNFFGERCHIQLPDNTPAFTGCVAFGIERWITTLTTHFAGLEPAEIERRIATAAWSDGGGEVPAAASASHGASDRKGGERG